MKPDNASQRTKEWDEIDERALHYHMEQWETPKRSTMAFLEFAAGSLAASRSVIGPGLRGGWRHSVSRRPVSRTVLPRYRYLRRADCSGVELAREKGVANLTFRTDDWFALERYSNVDTVVTLQSLSWLPEIEKPLEQIFASISPQRVLASSLFYEGQISCTIEVNEHLRDRKTFYNVYSLPALAQFCKRWGYHLAKSQPFQIDIDIPRPASPDLMSTYTVRAAPGSPDASAGRLQISGPLLLSWYFISIEKEA